MTETKTSKLFGYVFNALTKLVNDNNFWKQWKFTDNQMEVSQY